MSVGIIVVGAGGHGKVIADAAQAAGTRLAGFADHNPARQGREFLGLPVLPADVPSLLRQCRENDAAVVLGIGDNAVRARIWAELERSGVPTASVVHPSAIVARSVVMGRGCVVFAGAIVNAGAHVGDDVILNTGVRVDHDTSIGAHAHLSPGVAMGGEVAIGEGAHLAIGVSVRNRVSIGAWSIIGVGSAVVADVPERVVAYGVPARVRRALPG